MNKTARVVRQELRNNFGRISYVLVAFGIPILAVLVMGVVTLLQKDSQDLAGPLGTGAGSSELAIEGYVDTAGLIRVIPEDLPPGTLLPFESEDHASEALGKGEITAYYLVPPDYVSSGELFYVYPQSRSLLSDGQAWVMRWTLTYNLMGGDIEAASLVWNPVYQLQETQISPSTAEQSPVAAEDCSRPNSRCQSNELIRLIPSMMVALLFISFMASSNLLFQAIAVEKENRTMEVLLLSISPSQMLTGKTIALGIAGLLQIFTWLAAVWIMFSMGGSTFGLPESFVFPVEILLWSLLYFLGGYAVYASLMAGVGAMVPKMKEASAANFIVLSPLFLGYVVGLMAPLAEASDGALPVALSFIPLTAPVVMIMRLADGSVPVWQLLLSAALLFVSAYYILRLVAAMFHAQQLLSGQSFSISRYLRLLLKSSRSRPDGTGQISR